MDLSNIEQFYNNLSNKTNYWKKRNSYYHLQIKNLYKFLVPENKKILEIGSGNGDLLNFLTPLKGTGIDLSKNMINISSKKYPKLKFLKMDSNHLKINEPFEYIILSDLISNLTDIQQTFMQLHKVSNANTRIVLNYYNYLWYPFVILAEKFNLKMPQPLHNWLTYEDVKNFVELSDMEIIKQGKSGEKLTKL
jgi:ubiquinone/menaquinone biosynthesis C-methylase UbiE